MCDAIERIERRLAEDRLLGGILNRAIDDPVPSKKLLRAFAALSPWAVIPPIESSGEWGHVQSESSSAVPQPSESLTAPFGREHETVGSLENEIAHLVAPNKRYG